MTARDQKRGSLLASPFSCRDCVKSEIFLGERSQSAAHHPVQEDVGTAVEILETLDYVGQTRGHRTQVVGVDLGQVAGADDLGPLAATGDDGLDLGRGQVLALVQQHEGVLDAAPAHEVDRFELDVPSP